MNKCNKKKRKERMVGLLMYTLYQEYGNINKDIPLHNNHKPKLLSPYTLYFYFYFVRHKNFFFSVFKSAVSHFSKHRRLYSVRELPTRFEHWTQPRGIAAHREDHCRTTNLCPASIGLVSMVSYAMACTI